MRHKKQQKKTIINHAIKKFSIDELKKENMDVSQNQVKVRAKVFR
jgi:hypothetical protein